MITSVTGFVETSVTRDTSYIIRRLALCRKSGLVSEPLALKLEGNPSRSSASIVPLKRELFLDKPALFPSPRFR